MSVFQSLNLFVALSVLVAALPSCKSSPNDARISSLDVVSISALRKRPYGQSPITIEQQLNEQTYIAAYYSDGLRVYTRIDIPKSPPPKDGYPVVMFVHGWVGIQSAPTMDFFADAESNYDKMINAYVDAGFIVFTPGWRGHGTVNGIPADGAEFMVAWDNSSYLSPIFYAIDVLNLLDSLQSFDGSDLNRNSINMVSHSQGGDVALIALAVAGEGSSVENTWSAASFWSACFPTREAQFRTYSPMEKSPEAFLAGDGSWNATAVGGNGEVNQNFVFGYPPDWIETPHPEEWTWQKDIWATPTIAELMQSRLSTMYDAINSRVSDIDNAKFELVSEPGGKVSIIHDSRVTAALANIDAFNMDEYLTERVALHHSDRDFYSIPEWNANLCDRINAGGGECHNFEYAENTHSLGVSANRWFSSPDAVAGFKVALKRDIALFNGNNPENIQ